MKFTVDYPIVTVGYDPALVTAAGMTRVAQAAEERGYDAISFSEHPAPSHKWLNAGGHESLDQTSALTFCAAVTRRLRLMTYLLVLPYHNPFLAAKGIATLDVLSGGRTVVGLGAGYLEPEFEALGADFDERNQRMDEALVAMEAAWTGESVAFEGTGFRARGNTMLPRPRQRPRPPLWIGGNSRRSIRRAVESADGWCPFPNPARSAARTRTAPLESAADLAVALEYARSHAERVGRTEPLTVCFIPEGLSMGGAPPDEGRVVASIHELGAIGVEWVSVALPGGTRSAQLESIDRFGQAVLAAI